MGRSFFSTLQTSNLGRRFITRLMSDPSVPASRSRKVKTGTISETLELRISGHIPQIRENSLAVKPKDDMKSTVDLMSAREAEMIGG